MTLLRWAFISLLLAAVQPALAVPVVYGTSLSGPNEAPPNSSLGTGTSLLTVDTDNQTMRIQVLFFDIVSGTSVAHIHCCTAVAGAETAGVATQVPTFAGFPAGVAFGSYDQTFDMTQGSSWNGAFITANGGSPETAFSALVTGLNDGKAYLNLHSVDFPSGEIRGFYQTAVPAPAAVWLLGTAVTALMGRRLGRRGR